MKIQINITYDYLLNVLRSENGDQFLELLHDANPTSIREDLKYAKVFKNKENNVQEWDVCRKQTTAEFLYNEYVEGNLKIPLSILYKFPNYNFNIIERVKETAVRTLFLNTLKSKFGYVFENIIQAINDEHFNINLLSMKAKILKDSEIHPNLEFTEGQLIDLQVAIAEYIADAYMDGRLIINDAAFTILQTIAEETKYSII